MGNTSHKQLTLEFFTLFDTRDLDALAAAVSEDFVFHRPTRRGGVPDGTSLIVGRGTFREFLNARYPAGPSHHRVDTYIESGDTSFVSGTIEYPAESITFGWIGRVAFGADAEITTLHVSLFPNDIGRHPKEIS